MEDSTEQNEDRWGMWKRIYKFVGLSHWFLRKCMLCVCMCVLYCTNHHHHHGICDTIQTFEAMVVTSITFFTSPARVKWRRAKGMSKDRFTKFWIHIIMGKQVLVQRSRGGERLTMSKSISRCTKLVHVCSTGPTVTPSLTSGVKRYSCLRQLGSWA